VLVGTCLVGNCMLPMGVLLNALLECRCTGRAYSLLIALAGPSVSFGPLSREAAPPPPGTGKPPGLLPAVEKVASPVRHQPQETSRTMSQHTPQAW